MTTFAQVGALKKRFDAQASRCALITGDLAVAVLLAWGAFLNCASLGLFAIVAVA